MHWCSFFGILLPSLMLQAVKSCTPTEELPLQEKVNNADVMLLGEVSRKYDDQAIIGNAYTAEMNVLCILKAPKDLQIRVTQNITHAGVVDGRCYSVDLKPGSRYIILAYISGSNLLPYDSAKAATSENIMQVSEMCGLSPRLPAGAPQTGPLVCPTHVDSEGCIIIGDDLDHDDHDDSDHDHDNDGGHTHDDHHVGHDHSAADHDHDDHHDHKDNEEDHAHHHDDHAHDGNMHDHDGDGEHTHSDHHVGHGHDIDAHDDDYHHTGHDNHDHDEDHDHGHDHESLASKASMFRQAAIVVVSAAVIQCL